MKKPKKEDNPHSYYDGIGSLLAASHFIDRNGLQHKIPQGLKVYYQYRLQRFQIHESLGFDYKESINTVAKILGLSVDTIKKNYNPLLRSMGLLVSNGHILSNDHNYEVFTLDNLDGYLFNERIKETNVKMKEYKKDDNFTYETMKLIKHNKKEAHKIRRDKESKKKAIDYDRFLELLSIERNYKQLSKGDTNNDK